MTVRGARTRLPSRENLPNRNGRAYGPRMRFKVLGPLGVSRDDASIQLGGPKIIYAALADDTFRFDASDLMPPPIGTDLFWAAMMRYATEGPSSLDAILANLDAAWPNDG